MSIIFEAMIATRPSLNSSRLINCSKFRFLLNADTSIHSHYLDGAGAPRLSRPVTADVRTGHFQSRLGSGRAGRVDQRCLRGRPGRSIRVQEVCVRNVSVADLRRPPACGRRSCGSLVISLFTTLLLQSCCC